MEEEDFNIVPSETSKSTIDKPQRIKTPADIKQKKYSVLPNVSRDRQWQSDTNYHVGVDVSKYENDYNKGTVVMGPGGVEALNEDRANQQGWFEQARNMIGQAAVGEVIGGTIEGLGYLAEVGDIANYLDGTEKEWGNWMTDLGKETREESQDMMPIYQTKESGMGDSGWWFSNGVSVASSLSMLVPSMGATKALGMLGKVASKGAGILNRTLDIAGKMGKYESWMAKGITQAVVSRHIENSMEASNVFIEKKNELLGKINPKTNSFFTEEEATELASEGAASTYRSDWAMLLQDIPQYLALGKVFNPVNGKIESAIQRASSEGVKSGLKSKLMSGLETFVSEGFEESYQYYTAERGKLLSDLKAGLISEQEYDEKTNEKIGDKEMLTSAFWGGLGGNLFQAAGSITSDLFTSKERKAYEENYASIQGDYLQKRGAAFKQLQEDIAVADQTGDPAKRQAAIDGAGVAMAIEAVNNDKFGEHIESLQNMANMSEEEKNYFQESLGIELNPELFKQYIPSLIKQADSIRASYLKHLNKNDSNIAAKLAYNDHYTGSFKNRISTVGKEIDELKSSVPNINKLTDYYQDKFSTRANIVALKAANKIHQSALEKTSSPSKIANRKELIEKNNRAIEKLSKKMNELNSNDPRTKDEKDNDKLIGLGFENISEDLISKGAESIILNDAITLMQKDSLFIKSKEYQDQLKKKRTLERINKIQTREALNATRANLMANKEMPAKEKEEWFKKLDERDAAISNKEITEQAKANQAKQNESLQKEAKQKEKENPVAVPSNSIAPVGKNIEDEFSGEEADIHSKIEENEKLSMEKVAGSNVNIVVSAIMKNTQQGQNYSDWLNNGQSKIGASVVVTASPGNYNGNPPYEVAKAISDFMNGDINDVVIDYLPLVATFDGDIIDDNSTQEEIDSSKAAFLPAKVSSTNKDYEAIWNKDRAVREEIIKQIMSSEEGYFKTEVAAQYGGVVNSAEAVGGVIPENIISDFLHIRKEADDKFDLQGKEPTESQLSQVLEESLMYTNDYGELMDLYGNRHPDFKGREMLLPLLTGTTTARVPMRGAVFLSVPKADGTRFPLKLNIKKHSKIEAELVAGLLTSVIKKENKFNTPLSQLKGDIADKLINFQEEVELVKDFKKEKKEAIDNETDPKKKKRMIDELKVEFESMVSSDPSLMEIVDFFTYVSEKTKGKASELYVSGEWVKFGNGDLKVTPKALFNHDKLVDFLMNTKRKQFNVALWEASPSYRNYVISSGTINTDAVVDGPLFTGNVNLYIKAPAIKRPAPSPSREIASSGPKPLVANMSVRRGKSRLERAQYSEESGLYSKNYHDQYGDKVLVSRKSEEELSKAIEKMYENESKTLEVASNKTITEAKPLDKNTDDMSNLPQQNTNDREVLIKKDEKSNFTLIVKDGGIVVNKNTGKELDPKKDAKLINKALLKSGALPYQKITVGKQVYAATAINTIINITPGSSSNGNEISQSSSVGKKVMEQYTGKFTGKSSEVGVGEIEEKDKNNLETLEASKEKTITETFDPKTLLMGMNSLDLSNELAIKQEQEDLGQIDKVNSSPDLFDTFSEVSEAKETVGDSGGSEEFVTKTGEDLVRDMLYNGKMITEFTVSEQNLISSVPIEVKISIKEQADAYNVELQSSKNPEEEFKFTDDEVDVYGFDAFGDDFLGSIENEIQDSPNIECTE